MNTRSTTSLAQCFARVGQRGATFMQYVILISCVAIPALAAYATAGPKIADNLVKVALSVMGLEEGN